MKYNELQEERGRSRSRGRSRDKSRSRSGKRQNPEMRRSQHSDARRSQHYEERRSQPDQRLSQKVAERNTLGSDMLSQSQVMDQQLHPLRDSTWVEIFPILTLFDIKFQGIGTPSKAQTRAQRFMQEEAIEMGPIQKRQSRIYNQLIEIDDPQKALGAGISSYHQQLVHLGAIMLLMVILHIPALTIYNSYNFYPSALSSLTLGNMGFSEAHCQTNSMADQTIQLSCNTGMISELIDFGITTKYEDQESCTRKISTQYCNKFIHSDQFKKHFKDHCLAKTNCKIPDKFVSQGVQSSICFDQQSRFYAQYKCEQSSIEVAQKQKDSLIVSVFEVFSISVFIVAIVFNFIKTRKLGSTYDKLNFTVRDYSLYIEISDDLRNEFTLYQRQEGDRFSRGTLFKQFLTKMIHFDGITISRIDLTYDNEQLLDLLTRRGEAIKLQDYETIQKLEESIESLKPLQYNTKIVGAFITFERMQDIKHASILFREDPKMVRMLEKGHLKISKPDEPANISWRNLHVTNLHQKIRALFVSMVFLVLLWSSYRFQHKFSKLQFEYDVFENIQCDMYRYTEQKVLQKQAYATWVEYYFEKSELEYVGDTDNSLPSEIQQMAQKRTSFINGTLSCFCDFQYKQNGIMSMFADYTQKDTELAFGHGQICYQYNLTSFFKSNYFVICSFMVFLTNTVFILLCEPLIQCIRTHTLSTERILTSLALFLTLLLDTCILPILVRSNFSEYGIKQFDGRNTDFGASFYPDVGHQLVLNLLILSLRPLINVSFEVLWLKFSRYFRLNFLYSTHDNNLTDNIKYLELNAGPEYCFQRKTAALNVVIFMTLMFGVAFPLFYPICLFAVIIQYITERYTLAVWYRLPPKFSLDLTILNSKILIVSPIIASAISFWIFGNLQLFGYEVDELDSKKETVKSHHTIGKTLQRIFSVYFDDLSGIETIYFSLFVSISVLYGLTFCLFKKKQMVLQPQNLPDFFSAMKPSDLEEMLEEEKIYQELGVKNVDLKRIVKKPELEISLFGEPYYQPFKIFENWLIFNHQNYNEEKNIKLLLNLPLIPERKIDQVKLVHPNKKFYFKNKIQI